MKEKIESTLYEIAERDIPAVPDPWPIIHTRVVQTRRLNRRLGVSSPSAKKVLSAFCAMLLLIALPLTVFAVQTTFRRETQIAGIVPVEPATATARISTPRSVPGATPALAPTMAGTLPLVSVDTAQTQVSFPIRIPATVPNTVHIVGVIVIPGGTPASSSPALGVQVAFQSSGAAGGSLTIQEMPRRIPFTERVAASRVQQTMVHGYPAVYVKGSWASFDAASKGDDTQWDDNTDRAILSWQEGDMTYTITSFQLGLSHEDMTQIAESLK